MSFIDQSSVDPATVSNRSIAIKYGLYAGGAAVLLNLIGFLTNTDPSMPTTGAIKWVYTLLGIAITVWAVWAAMKEDREQLGGFISYPRCLGLGVLVGVVATVLGAVYTLLYTLVINPGFADQIKDASMEVYEKQGMSEEQIEMAVSMGSMFMNPIVLVLMQLIFGVLFYFIVTLLVGIIMKRDRNN